MCAWGGGENLLYTIAWKDDYTRKRDSSAEIGLVAINSRPLPGVVCIRTADGKKSNVMSNNSQRKKSDPKKKSDTMGIKVFFLVGNPIVCKRG